jgi:predicted dienelactone hydrolase
MGGRLPLDPDLLYIFQNELRTQCEFIVVGAQLAQAALDDRDSDSRDRHRQIWFGLQSVLISASNVSKLLWGSRAQPVVEARAPLRDSVGIGDDSPLSSRNIRNDFEHFDERLEEWFGQEGPKTYIVRYIGPPGGILIGGAPPTQPFGQFDPTTATMTFWDRSADVTAVVDAAQSILARLDATQDGGTGPTAPDA